MQSFPDNPSPLERGRARYARRAWAEAWQWFSLADREMSLDAADLERMATVAHLLGRDDDYLQALERAHVACQAAGEIARAVRCAFWIGLRLTFRDEIARANGWLARGQRLLERETRECAEQGYLLLPTVNQKVAAGDLEAAYAAAARALEIGDRCAEIELSAGARHLQGRVLILQGHVGQGQWQGAWNEAIDEARRTCERCRQVGNQRAAAAALYQQGEVHRLRGEIAAAEDAYRQASEMGCDPQPGLSLLRVAQGRADAAATAIDRALRATIDRWQRARLLPAHVEIMLAAGNRDAAQRGCDELDAIARSCASDELDAIVATARGALALEQGHAEAALLSARRALQLWQADETPYCVARVRVLAALACRALGDDDGASTPQPLPPTPLRRSRERRASRRKRLSAGFVSPRSWVESPTTWQCHFGCFLRRALVRRRVAFVRVPVPWGSTQGGGECALRLPLHVIENATDDPLVEQPEATLHALLHALERREVMQQGGTR